MPNYVTNRLEINADRETVQNVMDFLKGKTDEDSTPCYIDFNNIIPMPKDLLIEASTSGEFGMQYIIAQQREQIAYGDAVLHLESSSLDYNGRSVELTKNELKILYYLFRNGGKICSRGDMIEYLWDNQLYVDDNALSVNINRIREKLVGIGLTDFIKTKHRQGYTI